jgi:hypothetical protein
MFQLFQRYVASVSYGYCKNRLECCNGYTRTEYVTSVCFKCFIYFLDVWCKCFYLDVSYISYLCCKCFYLDVAYVFIWMLHTFHTYVASIFISMLHMFHTYVASVFIWMLHMFCNDFSSVFRCFRKCFRHMFQLFYLSSDACCKCFIWLFLK